MEYTNPYELPQPPVDYTHNGTSYTLNNLLITQISSSGWYVLYYFNFRIGNATISFGCPENCHASLRPEEWFYSYSFGTTNPVVFQAPTLMLTGSRGFYLNEVIYATFPIYDTDGTTIIREADTPIKTLTVSNSPATGGHAISYPDPYQIYCPYDAGEDDCEEILQTDTTISLETTANTGYAFSHWVLNQGGSQSTYTSDMIAVTMDEDAELEAVYVPVLEFPLSGYISTTVPITAVMDHSLTGGFYTADGRNSEIKAFNDLIADGTEHSYGGNVYCYDTAETNPFLGLNYSYGSEICYDEHPGFDFAVANGTDVLAPFAGKLYWATTDLVNGNPSTYGTFYIDHENGYTTWFLHCSGLTSAVATEVTQDGYAVVARGDHIAESSDKGSSGSYHLYFEVRKDGVDDEHVIDPYGWELWEE